MSNSDPAWRLTDEALTLILHAENDIISQAQEINYYSEPSQASRLGGTFSGESWRREVAVMRLIAAVEAFTDAASEHYFRVKCLPQPKQPFTWPARVKHYQREHSIDLKTCAGGDALFAGVDLRNCVAHGLGRLTDLLLHDSRLGERGKHISVNVAGNRMQTTHETVPLLAEGCRAFVLDVEGKLVSSA